MQLALNMSGENNNIEKVPSPLAEKPHLESSLDLKIENKLNSVISEKKEGLADKKISTDVKANLKSSSDDVNSGSLDYNYKQLQAVEEVMSSGLDQVFLKMDKAQQQKFKEEGEKTANKINQLLNKARGGVEKIIFLIKRWLGLIPNVNKFFLEQEAKIKADKILKIKRNL